MAEHPFDLLERELETAACRQLVAATDGPEPGRGRRWLRSHLGLGAVAAALGVSAAAWAATSLLATGDPVAYEHGRPPAPDRHYGTTVADSVQMLADDVPDPDGGLPWGLRTFTTSRGYGCLQVGRVQEGRLGVLALVSRRGVVRERGQFHALPAAVAAQATTCVPLDGGGHAFLALHLALSPDATPAACRYRSGGTGGMDCPPGTLSVDAGLLGPAARRVTFRRAGRRVTEPVRGAAGGYLVVQREVPPATRVVRRGGRAVRSVVDSSVALTPGSNVLTRVEYEGGPPCVVRPTTSPRGACQDPPGFTRIPQPDALDARTEVTAFPAPDRRGVRLRFRAPLAVVDGRSAYDVLVHAPRTRCAVRGLPPKERARFRGRTCSGGAFGMALERDVAAGEQVRTTIDLPSVGPARRPALRRGRTYRVDVTYRVQPPYPRITGSLAAPGSRVDSVAFTVR